MNMPVLSDNDSQTFSELKVFFENEFEINGKSGELTLKENGNLYQLRKLLKALESIRKIVQDPARIKGQGNEAKFDWTESETESLLPILKTMCEDLSLTSYTIEDFLFQSEQKLIGLISKVNDKVESFKKLEKKLNRTQLQLADVSKKVESADGYLKLVRQELQMQAFDALPKHALSHRGYEVSKDSLRIAQADLKVKTAGRFEWAKKRAQSEGSDEPYNQAKKEVEEAQHEFDKDLEQHQSGYKYGAYAPEIKRLETLFKNSKSAAHKIKAWYVKAYNFIAKKIELTPIQSTAQPYVAARGSKQQSKAQWESVKTKATTQRTANTAVSYLFQDIPQDVLTDIIAKQNPQPQSSMPVVASTPTPASAGQAPAPAPAPAPVAVQSQYKARLAASYNFSDIKDIIPGIIQGDSAADKEELKKWVKVIFPEIHHANAITDADSNTDVFFNLRKLLCKAIDNSSFKDFSMALTEDVEVETYARQFAETQLQASFNFGKFSIKPDTQNKYIASVLYRALLCIALTASDQFPTILKTIDSNIASIDIYKKNALAPVMTSFGGSNTGIWTSLTDKPAQPAPLKPTTPMPPPSLSWDKVRAFFS